MNLLNHLFFEKIPPKELEEITNQRNSISQLIGLGKYEEVNLFLFLVFL